MPVTFGGQRCLDPDALYRDAVARGLPTAPWYGLANSFRCPLGPRPGTGAVLLARAALARIDLARYQDLVFADDAGRTLTVKSVTVTAAQAVTPGADDDPAAALLVRLADRRLHLALTAIDKGYNVRPPDGGDYLEESRDAGVDWSWGSMWADIWAALGAGPAPALPFAPNGVPENFSFYGSSAWDAVNRVAERLACAVRYDPSADAFALVRVGAADAAADAAVRDAVAYRVWDEQRQDPARGWRPATVRVLFRRYPGPGDGSSPFYAVDVASPAGAGTAPGTTATVEDDLAAVGAGDPPDNDADLRARAAERAADHLRRRGAGGSPRLKLYEGVRPKVTAALGSLWSEWSVEDRGRADAGAAGGGLLTGLAARPTPPAFRAPEPAPDAGVRYARITAEHGRGRYTGVGGELFLKAGGDKDDPDDYEFRDITPAVGYPGNIYRVPSSRYDELPEPPVLPTIKAGQYVVLRPSRKAPGKWLASPWGSQLRVVTEVVYRTCSLCVTDPYTGSQVTRTKNAVRILGLYARDLRVLLKPAGTAEDGLEADIYGS